MSVTVVVGEQRGDEGKGRFVDMLAEEHDIIARFNGGHNAGHTVILPDDRRLELHLIPSGIAYPDKKNVIGNGTLLHIPSFLEEKSDIEVQDIEVSPENLLISSAAHLILPHHIYDDVIREGGIGSQGSTKSGIAPAAAAKAMRENVRAEIINNDPKKLYTTILSNLARQKQRRDRAGIDPIDQKAVAEEYVECARQIGEFVTDTALFLNNELDKRKPARILAEAAQAFLLDVDHGMYPYTTSSSTISGGASIGLGIPPHKVDHVVGVSKAVQSHVGGGPRLLQK